VTGWVLFAVTAAAGGLGAGLRYIVDVAVMRGRRGAFPLGILIVNVTGALALGIITGLGSAIGGDVATIIGVGALGGYTTFSTVSGETVLLGRRGRRDWAWANLIGTLVAAVLAAGLGLTLGRLVAGFLPS